MSDRNPSPDIKKRFYTLIASFLLIVTLYAVIFRLELDIAIIFLYIATSALFVLYFYLSYGFAKELPGEDDLNPAWTKEKRKKYAERIKRNKELSKSLIAILVPLMAVMAFDMLYRAFFS